jgi:membrane associated rhomboid family serine protease
MSSSLSLFPQTAREPQTESSLYLEIRTPPLDGRRALLDILAGGAFCTLIFFLFSVKRLLAGAGPSGWTWLVIFGAGLAASAWVLRQDRKNAPEGVLLLDPDRIRYRQAQNPEIEFLYEEVWTAHREGRGRAERLVLRGAEDTFLSIPVGSLDGQAGEALAYIRSRIAELPDGRQRLAAIAERETVRTEAATRRPWATIGLLGVLTLVFALEDATGALEDRSRLLDLGANAPRLVRDGELHRLATGNLLHANLFHFFQNAMALLALGLVLEPLLGAGLFLTLALVSALAGATGSALLGHHETSVGFSTALMGLFGALGVLYWRWKDHFRPTRKTWRSFAALFVVPALLFFLPIDHIGHLSGFLGGMIFALLATRNTDLKDLHLHHRRLYQGIAVLLIALFLLAALQVAP